MTRAELSTGEAIVGLLEAYGVDTVFGIPGVHNVEMYRALPRSNIRHILPRHEQGAGFMADGYARVTGKPGVCFVITGPGLTNIMTPMGQAYSDSVPMLVLASTLDVADAGQGLGRLHEMQSQRGAAATVAQRAVTAYTAKDARDHLAHAFACFSSQRPRPYYVEFPIDVMNAAAGEGWHARGLPERPHASKDAVAQAAAMLQGAEKPVLIIGGGARTSSDSVRRIAEAIGATLFTTTAAKGVLPDAHPLNAGAVLPSPSATRIIMDADVVLAAGTEVSETDLWYQSFDISGELIRIDIDAIPLAAPHSATLPIQADAAETLLRIADALTDHAAVDQAPVQRQVLALKAEILSQDDELRAELRKVLGVIRDALPEDAVVITDMTQIAYAGNEIFPVDQPNCWSHPNGFGTLGYGLPAAIGAKVGVGDRPVVALVGDYGLQYTINEIATAAELGLPLPILLWNNDALGQIRDDMVMKGIQPSAVTLKNPDFTAVARGYHCHAARPDSLKQLSADIGAALAADRPTLIEMTPRMTK